MTEQFANAASTTLSGSILNSNTSLVVASASAFPTSGNFRILVESEIMLVTGVSGTTFTVSRGQENTTAVGHNTGVSVTHILTSGALTTLRSDALSLGITAGTFSSRPAAGTAGRMYFPTDGGLGAVDDGSNWRPLLNGNILGTQPPAAASFTAFNQGASTLVDNNGGLLYTGVNDGATTTLRGYTQSIGSFTQLECALGWQTTGTNSSNTFSVGGIIFRESSSSKAYTGVYTINHNTLASDAELQIFSSNTTRTVDNAYSMGATGNAPIFLRIRKDATNVYLDWSSTRANWKNLDTRTIASVFTTAPDQIGIVGFGFNVIPVFNIIHYQLA